MKKRIKLFIDTEGDFYYKIPGPHFNKRALLKWRINKSTRGLLRYPFPSREGVINLIKVLKKYKFPATFCVCGHLFLKECSGWPHFGERKPEHEWFKKKIGNDWYYWDKGGNYKTNPGLYFGDLIEKEILPIEYFNLGLHGFAHECLTLEKKKIVDSIVGAGVKAAKEIGAKVDSFAAPFNMIEEKKDPDKVLDVLRKYKIKNVQYNGQDEGLKILRGPLSEKKIYDLEKRKGLELYGCRGYLEGTSKIEDLKKLIEGIKKSKEEYFTIVTHDFTWKNPKNMEMLLRGIKNITSY